MRSARPQTGLGRICKDRVATRRRARSASRARFPRVDGRLASNLGAGWQGGPFVAPSLSSASVTLQDSMRSARCLTKKAERRARPVQRRPPQNIPMSRSIAVLERFPSGWTTCPLGPRRGQALPAADTEPLDPTHFVLVDRYRSFPWGPSRLTGHRPVCAWCEKVRDETGSWRPIESPMKERGEALFTHGICPECSERVKSDSKRPATGSQL
jgi:hypothetical protein